MRYSNLAQNYMGERETVDRSGSVNLPDGTEIPYSQYYDLVQIEDQYYPYAETINAALKQGMDDYFADPENDISAGITGRGAAAKDGTYRDYVGVQGVYSNQGLLSIRMAHVRIIGDSQTNDYCGVTFRLSDCAQLSLEDIAGVTDIGLRRMVRRRIWSWFEQEGYSDIKKSDIEDYVVTQEWLKSLHSLLLTALQELPEDDREIIIQHYFHGIPIWRMADERGQSRQTIWNKKNKAFQSIRTGKHGQELAEYMPTVSKFEKALRLITQDREAIKQLQLTATEMEQLIL